MWEINLRAFILMGIADELLFPWKTTVSVKTGLQSHLITILVKCCSDPPSKMLEILKIMCNYVPKCTLNSHVDMEFTAFTVNRAALRHGKHRSKVRTSLWNMHRKQTVYLIKSQSFVILSNTFHISKMYCRNESYYHQVIAWWYLMVMHCNLYINTQNLK